MQLDKTHALLGRASRGLLHIEGSLATGWLLLIVIDRLGTQLYGFGFSETTFPLFTFARSDTPHSIDACTSLRALLVETHFWFRNHTSACVRISHWRLTRVFVLSLGIAIRRMPQCGAVRYRLQVIKNFPARFSQSKSNLLEGKMCQTFLVYN